MTLYLGDNLIAGVSYPVEPTRNIGQIIQSTIPLIDAGLHLMDGSLISGAGIYSDFVDYMKGLYEEGLIEELVWTSYDTGIEDGIGSIAFNGSLYVSVSTSATTATSTDGVNWIEQGTLPGIITHSGFRIAYGDGKFVIVSADGYVTTSTDGINWTTATQNAVLKSFSCHGIAYGNGKFVVVTSSLYSTSTDGINWEAWALLDGNYLNEIIFDGTKFIAMDEDRALFTSTDGLTWTAIPQSQATGFSGWYGLAYGNGMYISLNISGYISTSTDGIDWTTPVYKVYTGSNLGRIYYVNNRFTITFEGSAIYIGAEDYVLPEVPFNQPTISTNGVMGGARFAVSSNVIQYSNYDCGVYMAFDNNPATQFHSISGATTGYIDIYNPSPIKVTNIQIVNQGAANRASSAGKIYGSNDGTAWTQLKTYTNSEQSASGTWNISLSSNANFYLYYRIESTAGGSDSYWTIQQINLTATEQSYPNCFCSETEWQTLATNAGACGKFVYNSANNTVRLPKLNGFVEGTSTVSELGYLTPAGLPNITGHTGWIVAGGANDAADVSGAIGYIEKGSHSGLGSGADKWAEYDIDASRISSIYGNSNTVQPQSVKVFYYIVIATTTKTEIEVDIDEVATDLNGKADRDLSNLSNGLANTVCTTPATTTSSASSARPAVVVENYVNGASWYRVWSDGWCEQGGIYSQSNAQSTETTITLLKAYPNTNYKVFVTPAEQFSYALMAGSRAHTTSNFILSWFGINSSNYASAASWKAEGYIR